MFKPVALSDAEIATNLAKPLTRADVLCMVGMIHAIPAGTSLNDACELMGVTLSQLWSTRDQEWPLDG